LHQGGQSVTEVKGKLYSPERAKPKAIAPPQRARWPPTIPNPIKNNEFSQKPEISQNARASNLSTARVLFSPTHHPSIGHKRPHCQPGAYRFQPSLVTRAATSSPTPPTVEPYTKDQKRRKQRYWVLLGNFGVNLFFRFFVFCDSD